MKNRFCHNTKLSEETFGEIVYLCVHGSRATDAKKVLDGIGIKVSRQTITTLFLQLGEYMYRKNFRAELIAPYRGASPDALQSDGELEEIMLEDLWKNMLGTLDYAAYRKHKVPLPDAGEGLVGYLQIRWRFMNGFPRDKFTSHVGICSLQSLPGIPYTAEGSSKVANYILQQLAEDPL